jgi:uncharacterized HAD superfamily protein
MKAILVFIDGTICDDRGRHHLLGTAAFHEAKWILKDIPVPGSVDCLQRLAGVYKIVYIGARPMDSHAATLEWLKSSGFPAGPVSLGETQSDRLDIVKKMKDEFDFFAGIGDRWDDNTLHSELGCMSIILKEYVGGWGAVFDRIRGYHKNQVVARNMAFVEGKVEGLARVCPLLLKKFGGELWEGYQQSVREMAESSRSERRLEDLASFNDHHLNPTDLSDMARWYRILDEENWETESLYGLQERELLENTRTRYVEKVTRCYLAELWKKHGLPEVGYQIHCRTDAAWWDRPAWNPAIRFEQPKTLMQGDDYCLFVQTIPEDGEKIATN